MPGSLYFGAMMRVVLVFVFCCFHHLVLAQQFPDGVSARAAGMGLGVLAQRGPLAVFGNVAALQEAEVMRLEGEYQGLGQLPELKLFHLGMSAPVAGGSVGVGLRHWGGPLYREQELALGYSRRMGLAALGLGLGYRQFFLDGQGYERRPLLRMSGLAYLTPALQVGVSLENVNQAVLRRLGEGLIPVRIHAGMQWQPGDDLVVLVEAMQESARGFVPSLGLEYGVSEHVFLRTGLYGRDLQGTYGLGLYLNTWRLDLAYRYVPGLGSVYRLGMRFSPKGLYTARG